MYIFASFSETIELCGRIEIFQSSNGVLLSKCLPLNTDRQAVRSATHGLTPRRIRGQIAVRACDFDFRNKIVSLMKRIGERKRLIFFL